MPEKRVPRTGFIIPGASPLNVGAHCLPIHEVVGNRAPRRDAFAGKFAGLGIVVDIEWALYVRRAVCCHSLNPSVDIAA